VRRAAGRCTARVSDSGVGLQSGSQGLGTGLQTLRERLRLASAVTRNCAWQRGQPQGVAAEVEFPSSDERRAPPP
jgi:signal transduction histidine kinase